MKDLFSIQHQTEESKKTYRLKIKTPKLKAKKSLPSLSPEV